MISLYFSEFAFMEEGETVTDSNKNCPRHILFRIHGLVPKDIPEIYKRIGSDHEEALWKDLDHTVWRREVPLKQELAPGVFVSGRTDFISDEYIIEAKATASKDANNRIIKKGLYREDHLAQLVGYMIGFEKTYAELNYQILKLDENNENPVPVANRVFCVSLAADGEIFVDDKSTGKNKQQLLDNLAQQVKVVRGELVPVPRPRDSLINWKPCNFCPFKIACQEYDSGNDGSIDCLLTLAKRYRDGNA